MSASPFLFERAALVGIGLIGSSVASALKTYGGARKVVCFDAKPAHLQQALELEIVDEVFADAASAVAGADLVMLCVPVGSMAAVAKEIAPHLASGCIVSDVGSVKQSVLRDLQPLLPQDVFFIPGHPIAGIEESGPGAGFAELFQDHFCILTPPEKVNAQALAKLKALWKSFGAKVEIMSGAQHDRVLATVSHLPHLVAFGVALTAGDIEEKHQQKAIRYSAGGFRDVTRVAASDPVMWRDIFLNNREAALEVMGLFAANLAKLQQAVEAGDGEALEALFARARKIKRETQVG